MSDLVGKFAKMTVPTIFGYRGLIRIQTVELGRFGLHLTALKPNGELTEMMRHECRIFRDQRAALQRWRMARKEAKVRERAAQSLIRTCIAACTAPSAGPATGTRASRRRGTSRRTSAGAT